AFEQTKSVPVQFFSDGEPAEAQHVWRSPWGRIGICICYDLGYTRVVDELIRQGAEALVVPTMDLQSWGRREHELHARVAPVRSREYGVSIFRVCSSGISQLVRCGRVIAEAPFPGQGATLAGTLAMRSGSLPLDRRFAPWMSASVPFILLALWLVRRRPRHGSAT
ncbi:MAG: hypothetical protein KDC87_09840, partial [Planctomycetes bacterium]|nr:hypothetical protein [Planctomycetota bacterium]